MAEKESLRLGEILIQSGKLNESQLRTAINYQKSLGGKLGTIVTKLGFVSDDELTQILARHQQIPLVDLEAVDVPDPVLTLIPRDFMEKHFIIPLATDGGVITVAMWDPTDYEVLEEVQFITGQRVDLNLAPRAQISRKLAVLFDRSKSSQMLRKKDVGAEPPPVPAGDARLDLTGWEMRRALIPLMIEKGLITEEDLRRKARELS
ncbi:MAG: hypothetical protein HY719_10730 [Planctomycetes bacterium]|nr:hypothetical protein [Planctomycetota bacterium]